MKTITRYTGRLSVGDIFQCKSDGSIIKIENIEKYNGVWAVRLKYTSALTKVGQEFMANAYDFETDTYLKGIWKKM